MPLLKDRCLKLPKQICNNRTGVQRVGVILIASVTIGTFLPWTFLYLIENINITQSLLGLFAIQPPKPLVILFPIAMACIAIFSLCFEAIHLGYYNNSTLYLLIEGKNASLRNDLFYFFLRVTGFSNVLAFIMALGMSKHLEAMTVMGLEYNLMSELNPFLQFFVLVIFLTFFSYWTHRIWHTKLFYEIHKVHHSAEQMGVLLPFRAHPIDHLVTQIYTAGVLSLLGTDTEVIMVWMGINALYQSMVHSKLDWPTWLSYIVVTPALHRVHHSSNPRHFNKNLAILTIWDKLFGTYHPPESVISYGVDNKEKHHFNTDQYLNEVVLCFFRWIGISRN